MARSNAILRGNQRHVLCGRIQSDPEEPSQLYRERASRSTSPNVKRFPVMRMPTRNILAESQITAAVVAMISPRDTRISHDWAAPTRMRRNMTMGAVSGKRTTRRSRAPAAW